MEKTLAVAYHFRHAVSEINQRMLRERFLDMCRREDDLAKALGYTWHDTVRYKKPNALAREAINYTRQERYPRT